MIEAMIEMGKEMAETDAKTTSNFRALYLLAEQWRKHKLPIKYIGRVKVDVNDSFFEDEDEAKELIANVTTFMASVYSAIVEEFGEEDAPTIFGDCASEFSVSYSF
jgi:hypothetical protein